MARPDKQSMVAGRGNKATRLRSHSAFLCGRAEKELSLLFWSGEFEVDVLRKRA